MKNIAGAGLFLLRLVLETVFFQCNGLVGLLVGPGPGASWGDWKHFVDYTNTLIFKLTNSQHHE